MNLYFLSEITAHLKVDGEYLGTVSKNMLVGESENEPKLVEFLPLSADFSPVYYTPYSPEVKRYLSPDGLLFLPIFPPKHSGGFKVLFQRALQSFSGQITITVTVDSGAKLYVDGAFCKVVEIPFIPSDFSAEIYGDLLAVSFYKKKTALYIFRLDGTLEYFDVVDEFQISSLLTDDKRYKNSTLTTIIEKWNLSSPFSLIERVDKKEKDFFLLPKQMLPLAFFENAKIGGSIKEIATPNFYQKAENLRGFLGKILGVVPSPKNEGEVWILGENNLSIATLSLKNGLVDNVFIEDF